MKKNATVIKNTNCEMAQFLSEDSGSNRRQGIKWFVSIFISGVSQ